MYFYKFFSELLASYIEKFVAVNFRRLVKVPDESDKWWMEEDRKNALDENNVDLDEDIDNSVYKVNGG